MTTDKHERLKAIENIFISSPHIQEIIDDIEDFRKWAKFNEYRTEPDCILVTGGPGSGKTWLIEKMNELNPRIEEEDRTKIQILSSSIPKARTPKPVVQTLLRDIGDPLLGRGDTIDSLTKRLVTLIENTGVELIIIDEFQHCIESYSKKVLHDIGDWLKTLINDSKRPIVLFGMTWSDIILETNPQLARRFPIHHSMPVYTEKNFSDFLQFLGEVEKQLPFKNSSGLTQNELAFRLLCCSNGNIGTLMKNIIKKAAIKAVKFNLNSIPLEYISDAVEKFCGYSKENNLMLKPIDSILFETQDDYNYFPNHKINISSFDENNKISVTFSEFEKNLTKH
ncbi:TniB family NTP-binding protein [Endozoicomonas elysicola]|uniref:TniB family NTP-binding protein n=1 Tax=Endozoicomonas elysicola TaxID=305900 RepID=UPI000371AA93|nr:TniB family NTP-binding protein [Endozoicomonas elysicola]